MPLPVKKKTSSKTRKGRSHEALKKIQLNSCAQCHQSIRPHFACSNCGTYKSREVVRTQADKKAAQKARKEAKEKKAMQKN